MREPVIHGQKMHPTWASQELCAMLGQRVRDPVVCLRGGERGTCLGSPFLGAPLRCYARKFSLVLMKNVLSTHIMYYKADHK